MIPKKEAEDYNLKFLALLSILFYLASCVSGNQTVESTPAGQGVSGPPIAQPSQASVPGYPPPLPFPPNLAFIAPYCNTTNCPGQVYPFTRTTAPSTLTVQITNPNNLPYTQEWLINNTVRVSSSNSVTPFIIDPNDSTYFPTTGFYTIVSRLLNSTGGMISTLVWSIDIIGSQPSFSYLNPLPAPTPYVNSPFSIADSSTQTITATISNPQTAPYYFYWYLDGVQQLPASTQASPSVNTFTFIPSNLSEGLHTVVGQLSETASGTPILNTATWSFEISNLPLFNGFIGQQPSPNPPSFNINFGGGASSIVVLQPNILFNPQNATYTLEWELDGVVQASSTYINPSGTNGTPTDFVLDGNDATQLSLGRHSVVAIVYDYAGGIADSANWNFDVVFPAPASLTYVGPAANLIDSVPVNSSATVIAVSTVPLNATITGFFEGPGDDSSRGTPLVIGTSSFCVGVSDGGGVGSGTYPAAGVQVQFYQGNYGMVGGPLEFQKQVNPPPVCLDGSGASSGAGVPTFSLSLSPTDSQTSYQTPVIARIRDIVSLQQIAEVEWEVTVSPLNTPPIISMGAGVQNGDSIVQDATYTYSFSVTDKDGVNEDQFESLFSFSTFGLNVTNSLNIPLNGSNTYYPGGPPSPLTPNCVRSYTYVGADKYECQIIIPSNNGTQPVGASGTYQINAVVNNLSIYPYGTPPNPPGISNLYGPQVSSNILTWNLNIIESNTQGPYLLNEVLTGTATSSDSYVYLAGSPGIASNSYTENQSIQFNLNVNDLEKDDYTIKIFYTPNNGTETEAWSSTATYTIAGNPLVVPPILLPENIVTNAAAATITFNIQLTDVPDTATPITTNNLVLLNITNNNPPPDVSSATYDPVLAATATVIQGFPYTFEVGQITDASTMDGNGLVWQWMINGTAADCASQTAASWESIIGATQGPIPLIAPQTASLTWSPSQTSGLGHDYCFRNCIGDDGFGNPVVPLTCQTTMAGPWPGPINGVAADRNTQDLGVPPTDRAVTAVWRNGRDVYGVQTDGNMIYVVRYTYNQDGTVAESYVNFPTDPGDPYSATSTEGAYDISITGEPAGFIFVSYVFNKTNGYTGIPTLTVAKIPEQNFVSSGVRYAVADDVVSGAGQIFSTGLAAFAVPYLRSIENDIPYIIYGNSPDPATMTSPPLKTSLGIGISSSQILSVGNQTAPLRFFIAIKSKNGVVNLYSYNVVGTTISGSALDVFPNQFISDLALASGGAGNDYVYLAGKDIADQLIYYIRAPNNNLGSIWHSAPNPSSGTYPDSALDVTGINAVASPNAQELILGVIKTEPGTPSSTNGFLLKIRDNDIIASNKINQYVSAPGFMIDGNDFAITTVFPSFQVGNAGAVPNENQKDTLWFRYYSTFDSFQRNVIVNIEEEKFSSTATSGGEPWSQPWFQAP